MTNPPMDDLHVFDKWACVLSLCVAQADVLRQKAKGAEEIAGMAAHALQLAEEGKKKAEVTWQAAEAERQANEAASREVERLRREGREEVRRRPLLPSHAAIGH